MEGWNDRNNGNGIGSIGLIVITELDKGSSDSREGSKSSLNLTSGS